MRTNDPYHHGPFTPEEDQILRDNYERLTPAQIRERFLPHRTKKRIATRERSLGLLRPWTPGEDEYIRTHYPEVPPGELSRSEALRGRSYDSVKRRIEKLGLKKPPAEDGKPTDGNELPEDTRDGPDETGGRPEKG